MLGKLGAAFGAIILLSGCGHMIDALENNMQANAEAIKVCSDNKLSIKAQQNVYKQSVGSILAHRLSFPLDDQLRADKNTIAAIIDDLEDQFRTAYAAAYENADTTLRSKMAGLEKNVSKIRGTSDRIGENIRKAFDEFELGFTSIVGYQPTLLRTAYVIQADFRLLRQDILTLRIDLRQFANSAAALSQAEKKRFLDLANTTLASAIEVADVVSQFLTSVRDSKPISNILSDDLIKEIEEKLLIVIRYKAAKLAVNRLERGLYIVEGKLAQIDEKAWFAISIAQLLFTDAIRQSIISAEPALNATSDSGGGSDDQGARLRRSIEKFASASTYGSDIAPASVRARSEGELRQLWLQPLATAACERVTRFVENNDVTAARTDQLLNPIYLAVVAAYDRTIKPPAIIPRSGQPVPRSVLRANQATDSFNIIDQTLNRSFKPLKLN